MDFQRARTVAAAAEAEQTVTPSTEPAQRGQSLPRREPEPAQAWAELPQVPGAPHSAENNQPHRRELKRPQERQKARSDYFSFFQEQNAPSKGVELVAAGAADAKRPEEHRVVSPQAVSCPPTEEPRRPRAVARPEANRAPAQMEAAPAQHLNSRQPEVVASLPQTRVEQAENWAPPPDRSSEDADAEYRRPPLLREPVAWE